MASRWTSCSIRSHCLRQRKIFLCDRRTSSRSVPLACLSNSRCFSTSWGKGQDMLAGSLAMGIKPKVTLDSYGHAGFDVTNIIKKVHAEEKAMSGILMMNGSILAFPHSCFLWRMEDISEVTLESLAPVLLHRPKVEYLFLGSETPMQLETMLSMKKQLRKSGITFEQLDLVNAMGTFNILNGEDRVVAAALIVPKLVVEVETEEGEKEDEKPKV